MGRAVLGVVVVIWIIGSAYYSMNGFKTRRGAIAQLKEEREGNYVPPPVVVDAQLPKSLEEKLLAIAEAEARGDYGPIENDAAAPTSAPPDLAERPLEEVPPPSADIAPGPVPGADVGTDPAAVERPAAVDVAPPPSETVASIFDSPAPPPPPVSDSSSAITIAEALQGIELPCDLVPLVAAGEVTVDPRRVAFITRGFAATAVALELRDALVAVGFTVTPTGPMTATAIRGSESIDVLVHDHPMAVFDGNARRFPSATQDTVVVELSSR